MSRRVVIVTGDYPPRHTGVGDYSSHLAAALAGRGVAVEVLTTRLADGVEDPQAGVAVTRDLHQWTMRELGRVVRRVRSGAPPIVDIQYNCPSVYRRNPMVNILPLALRLAAPQCTVVTTMHGFWEQSLFYRLRTIPMLRASSGIVLVDEHNREPLRRFGGLSAHRMAFIQICSNIVPIPYDVALRERWRTERGITLDDFVVAFFGGIGRVKGFEYLVEGVAEARRRSARNVILMALGGFRADGTNEGYHETIRRRLADVDKDGWVRIVADPSREEVSACLHCADAAVYPFTGGVGSNSSSALAALFHGLPTVLTDGITEARSFYDAFGVLWVRPRDSAGIAARLLELMGSPELRGSSRNAALTASAGLTWDRVAGATLAFFDRVSNSARQ
ncbi:MAG: glycosyltransferase family 4 protein [Acidobacteria bacterium]|nr:glycosyltransferase family 4 protein [Acidobacteriota bacterium]